MLTRNSLVVGRSLLVVALSTTGCGGVTEPGEEMMGHEDDVTAPAVASTSPADKAVAVASGDKIIITFSEAMDRQTFEAAFQSAELQFDQLSSEWNEEMTVVTLSPDAGLAYAEGIGSDPSAVPAQTYTFTIGSGTADLAGNTLGSDYTFTFATKRRMVTWFDLEPSLTRVSIGGTLLGSSNDIWVGDNAVKNQYKSFLTFDMQYMPEGAVIEHAEFSARQLTPQGFPYGQLGPVQAHHVSYADLNGFNSMEAISLPGMYSSDDAQTKTLDVTSQVADDYANRVARGSRSQYRLQMDTPTNDDDVVDKAIFSLATFELAVTYIAD